MADIVLMPQLGISEESAILTAWHVKQGENVTVGDRLFSIETGKSAFDVESEFSGAVLALLVNEGDEVPVKQPVCVIGEEGEIWKSESANKTDKADKKVGISPRARNLAAKAGVDPSLAVPSGPEGRIIERDVRAFIDTGDVADIAEIELIRPQEPSRPQARSAASVPGVPDSAFEERPLSAIRGIIAKNMVASLQNAAQLTHTAAFDASNIQDYRKQLKTDPELSGVTLTDMIHFAVTRTLPSFPELNAWLMGDTMRLFSDVNLGCAVDTDKGLMVPVLFGANRLSLLDMSNRLKTLAEDCRDGRVAPDLLSGGSFTVSNLGRYGIESFTPIINPPQTGILGVNTITQRAREQNGALRLYPCMTLSLTYDHRALDGAPASRFLQMLCQNLERFTTLLAR